MSSNGGRPRVKYLYLHFKVCGFFSPQTWEWSANKRRGNQVSLANSFIIQRDLQLWIRTEVRIHINDPRSFCWTAESLLPELPQHITSFNLSKVSPPKKLMWQNVTTETVSWHEQWERRLLLSQLKQKKEKGDLSKGGLGNPGSCFLAASLSVTK